MFNFIKDKLSKIYTTVTDKTHELFSRTTIDEHTLKDLEKILITADTGFATTHKILTALKQKVRSGTISRGSDLQTALQQELLTLLADHNKPPHAPIYLLVGINGSGKTTFAGKLTHKFTTQNKRVLLAAADTFRAAATQQLEQWATRTNADIVVGNDKQDPASVVFQACEQFKNGTYDTLIIDTAGRLQTKVNLMHELAKIKRIITKQLPDTPICTLLTVDAMLGQNSFEQAKLFNESTELDGIVLTKMDGTGKGGIVFAITQELNIPVAYISYGEQLEHLKEFNAQDYVHELIG